MERAAELIAPYTRLPWVRGIYLVGSASRPFRDRISDYDFEVAVEDGAYAGLSDAERHVYSIEPGPPPRVDYEFLLRPWGELESLVGSTRDVDHYPFQHARVLYDPEGALARLLARIAALPDDVRDERLRVHYMELFAGSRRAAKCFDRGESLNARLVVAGAVEALAKLLHLLAGSWPAMRHWTSHELRLAGVDDSYVAAMTALVEHPDPARMTDVLEEANRRLDEAGVTFHRDIPALRVWAFLSPEGKRAFAAWGSR